MSNDRKVYGDIMVKPPLNWRQIRAFQKDNNRLSQTLRLVIEEFTEETDEGSIVTKSCQDIHPATFEHAWGVAEALEFLGKIAPENEFCGEFTIVDEHPEFSEKHVEAYRYALSDGKLYVAEAQVIWGDYKKVIRK